MTKNSLKSRTESNKFLGFAALMRFKKLCNIRRGHLFQINKKGTFFVQKITLGNRL